MFENTKDSIFYAKANPVQFNLSKPLGENNLAGSQKYKSQTVSLYILIAKIVGV